MDEKIRVVFVSYAKVGDLCPEVVGVGANSVNAMIFSGNNHGQHFSLATT